MFNQSTSQPTNQPTNQSASIIPYTFSLIKLLMINCQIVQTLQPWHIMTSCLSRAYTRTYNVTRAYLFVKRKNVFEFCGTESTFGGSDVAESVWDQQTTMLRFYSVEQLHDTVVDRVRQYWHLVVNYRSVYCRADHVIGSPASDLIEYEFHEQGQVALIQGVSYNRPLAGCHRSLGVRKPSFNDCSAKVLAKRCHLCVNRQASVLLFAFVVLC